MRSALFWCGPGRCLFPARLPCRWEVDRRERIRLAATVCVLHGHVAAAHGVARHIEALATGQDHGGGPCLPGHHECQHEYWQSLHLAPPTILNTMITPTGNIQDSNGGRGPPFCGLGAFPLPTRAPPK